MRYPWFRLGIFVLASFWPLFWLYQAWAFALGPDPGKVLVDRLGVGGVDLFAHYLVHDAIAAPERLVWLDCGEAPVGLVVLCLCRVALEWLPVLYSRSRLGAIRRRVAQTPPYHCGCSGICRAACLGCDFESLQPAAAWGALEEVAQVGLCDPGVGVAAFSVGRACRSEGVGGLRWHWRIVVGATYSCLGAAYSEAGDRKSRNDNEKLNLSLDAPFHLSIMRTSSGAVETENSLVINELNV